MTTHLPEARGWPRPQCSHDSLCRPGQTSERRSQCHHLLRLQSNYNSKLATLTMVGAPHLQMDAQSKFNHSVVYTKHGVYCWKYVHEVKRLLKEAGERILRVIHSIHPPHTVSLALRMYACSDPASLVVPTYAIAANGLLFDMFQGQRRTNKVDPC